MRRTVFILALLMLFGVGVKAQELPEGATLRYYGERSFEQYGLSRQSFTIYEQAGTTYLMRTQLFSGALEMVIDIDGIARNAREVTMPLTSRQVKSIRKALKKSRFPELLQTFLAEQQTYDQHVKAYMAQFEPQLLPPGDTTRQLIQRPKEHIQFHAPSHWQQTVSWPGTLEEYESTHSFYITPTYDDNWTDGHPARDQYLAALDAFHQQLNDMVYAYKMQHPYEGEIRSYAFTTGAGYGRYKYGAKHQGSKICLEEIDGRWVVDGYFYEQEDTVAVGPEVVRRVEEMFGQLDFSILHPKFTEKDGEVIRTEVTDQGAEMLSVSFNTRESMFESVPRLEGYMKPEWAAKAYKALVKGINDINVYLWNFLSIKFKMLEISD